MASAEHNTEFESYLPTLPSWGCPGLASLGVLSFPVMVTRQNHTHIMVMSISATPAEAEALADTGAKPAVVFPGSLPPMQNLK